MASLNPKYDFTDRLDFLVTIMPVGASYLNCLHYGQQVYQCGEKPCFLRWDYGSDDTNQAHYGQKTPPEYNLGAIKVPLAIFGGSDDALAYPKDVEWAYTQMQNTTELFQILDNFDHTTFILSRNMDYFKNDVMNFLNKHNPNYQNQYLKNLII